MNTHPITDQTQDRSPSRAGGLTPRLPAPSFRSRTSGALSPSRDTSSASTAGSRSTRAQQRQITLTIDAASLHTGSSKRDKHLRSAAFFDTQNHPEVRFRSTSVSDAGEDRLRVEGVLEAAGERVALRLEPTIHQTDDQLDIEATTTVDQRLLGMTWSPLGMTRTPATLIVHARLRRES